MMRSALVIGLLCIALLIVASSIFVAPALLALGENVQIAAFTQWCVLCIGGLVALVTGLYDRFFGNNILDA